MPLAKYTMISPSWEQENCISCRFNASFAQSPHPPPGLVATGLSPFLTGEINKPNPGFFFQVANACLKYSIAGSILSGFWLNALVRFELQLKLSALSPAKI